MSSGSASPECPESYQRITDGLYLGDKNAAADLALLSRLGITHILTAELIPLPDLPEADLLSHLERTTRFIRSGTESGGAVLVHCYHGISRSAAIVVAYLMRTMGVDVRTALSVVTRSRPKACPNDGFLAQLKLYGHMGCKLDADNKAYKLYRMQVIQHSVIRTHMVPQEAKDLLPSSEQQQSRED